MSEIQSLIDSTLQQYQAGKTDRASLANKAPDKVGEAAQDFEAVFISQMLTPMFDGIEPDGMFGGGSAENVYKSMMLEEYGKLLAANGGVGISGAVKAEMLQMQAKQQGGL